MFYIKVFKTLYFLNPQMDLVYIKHNIRYCSKILLSTIHTPAHDLEVKDRNFMLKFAFSGLRNFMLKFEF